MITGHFLQPGILRFANLTELDGEGICCWSVSQLIFHTCKHSVKYILILYSKKLPLPFAPFLCTHVTYRNVYLDGFLGIFVPKIRVTFRCFHEDFPAFCPHFPTLAERNLTGQFGGWVRTPCFVPWAHWDCNIQLLGCEDADRGMEDHRVKVWLEDELFSFQRADFFRFQPFILQGFLLKWDWIEIVEVQKSNFRFLKVDTILGIYG